MTLVFIAIRMLLEEKCHYEINKDCSNANKKDEITFYNNC